MDNRVSIIPKYIICVDKIINGALSGRLYCGCLPDGKTFTGIEEMVLTIDRIMDMVGFPQATVDKRSFENKQERVQRADRETLLAMRKFVGEGLAGDEETFVLQVRFRQNASWQGNIEILNLSEEREYKSVLELIRIFDQVCSESQITKYSNKNI